MGSLEDDEIADKISLERNFFCGWMHSFELFSTCKHILDLRCYMLLSLGLGLALSLTKCFPVVIEDVI